jgi:hypothetical protein
MKNWPIKPSENLAEFLHEQGESLKDAQELAQVLSILDSWQAPTPTATESKRLSNRLMALIRARSSVRNALKNAHRGIGHEFVYLLRLVRAQVSLLRVSFWLTSALIVLLGCLLLLNETNLNRAVVLQIIGPLLCYLGAASAFRGLEFKTLELELACPPSARQLTLARLIIIIGYDIVLCLAASLVFSSQDGGSLMLLSLHWLAPLLLVYGLTLLLSIRMPAHYAAALTYAGWLAVLILALVNQDGIRGLANTFSSTTELGFGLAGTILIGVAIAFLPKTIIGLLPGKKSVSANLRTR